MANFLKLLADGTLPTMIGSVGIGGLLWGCTLHGRFLTLGWGPILEGASQLLHWIRIWLLTLGATALGYWIPTSSFWEWFLNLCSQQRLGHLWLESKLTVGHESKITQNERCVIINISNCIFILGIEFWEWNLKRVNTSYLKCLNVKYNTVGSNCQNKGGSYKRYENVTIRSKIVEMAFDPWERIWGTKSCLNREFDTTFKCSWCGLQNHILVSSKQIRCWGVISFQIKL